MELDTEKQTRSNTIVAVAALAVLGLGLGLQIALASRLPQGVGEEARKHLTRLAWVGMLLLAFDVVVLFWLTIRAVSTRNKVRQTQPTTYIDAWAAAGERIQIDDDDEDTPDIP